MRKTAFTLIELLVTIVLFSLLLATSLYSFRFVSINIKNINNSNPKKAINYALLRGTISSIYPYVEIDTTINNNNNFYCYFKGDSIKFRFITLSPIFYKTIAIAEVSFIDNKLIYREGKIFDKEVDYSKLDSINLTQKIVILDNVSDVKFLYYIEGKKELTTKEKIPNLIKIKFIHYRKEREYLFTINSNSIGRLNMIKTQYKDF